MIAINVNYEIFCALPWKCHQLIKHSVSLPHTQKTGSQLYLSGDGPDAADVHDRHDDDGNDDVEANKDEDLPQLVDQLHPADAVQTKSLCK